jgi:hypothetical protein
MARWRPVLCIVFGLGHRWEAHNDAAGSVTSCRRCGTLRHTGIEFEGATEVRLDAPGDPEGQMLVERTIKNWSGGTGPD